MSAGAKEKYFGGIQFISQSKNHGRLEHNEYPLRRFFQFRENLEYPLAGLERLRVKGGFNLYLKGTWSANIENAVGYDTSAEALALTSKGVKEGSLGEFAQEGLYILEVGVRNLEPIPDVNKVLLELKFGRGTAKISVYGSLPNLGMSQEEPIEGLISIGTMGESKGEAKGGFRVKPYIPRIPGVIGKWVKDPYGLTPLYVMSPGPEGLSALSSIRGALRVLYNLS